MLQYYDQFRKCLVFCIACVRFNQSFIASPLEFAMGRDWSRTRPSLRRATLANLLLTLTVSESWLGDRCAITCQLIWVLVCLSRQVATTSLRKTLTTLAPDRLRVARLRRAEGLLADSGQVSFH